MWFRWLFQDSTDKNLGEQGPQRLFSQSLWTNIIPWACIIQQLPVGLLGFGIYSKFTGQFGGGNSGYTRSYGYSFVL